MILFITNKDATIADLIEATGIRPNNFWFEYFMQLFKNSCFKFDDLQSLVNYLSNNKADAIRRLEAIDIDGQFFTAGVVYALEQDTFANVNFTRVRSRKIKVFELSNTEAKNSQ